MDTVTFVVTPVVNNGVILLFAIISLICYLMVFYVSDKVFHRNRLIVYIITAILGLGLSSIINFIVYTLLT